MIDFDKLSDEEKFRLGAGALNKASGGTFVGGYVAAAVWQVIAPTVAFGLLMLFMMTRTPIAQNDIECVEDPSTPGIEIIMEDEDGLFCMRDWRG